MAVDEPGPDGSRSPDERMSEDPQPIRGPSPVDGGRSLVGVSFGRYQILEELGGGGMGVVYRAHDTRLDRTVALKFLPAFLSNDSQARSRFFAEARAASALDHANVCTVHEIGETDDGQIFISMAAYNGETLKKKISRGAISQELAMEYAVQTARGLARAHAKGIIHRDIKPANIMVTDDGVVKILDFGTAKTKDLALTQTGTSIGTVGYMSPEQAEGDEVDARTDLWSLGALLYQMLAGEEPFKGDRAVAIVYSILCEEPKPLHDLVEGIAPELVALVSRCLAKDKDERYGSANELIADLEAVAARSGARLSLAPATTRYMADQPKLRRPRTAWILAGLGAAAVLLSLPSTRALVSNLGDAPSEGRQYLALLPIQATNPTDEILAIGLTESLTTAMARLSRTNDSIWVVPASEIRNRGVEDAAAAWRTFGTTTVLTGSLQRSGSTSFVMLNRVEN